MRGEGPPLLLVHGLGYDRRGWGPAADALAAHFTVLLFDNRGIGESDAPPGPYAARELAADAVAVLGAARIERAAVLGASLGGMVAQELAIGWPERVERLVLVATTPGGPESHPLPEATARLLDGARTPSRRELVANALAPDAPGELVDRILAVREQAPQKPAAWSAQAAAARDFDAFARLPRIVAPTLVLHGDADSVVDPRNAELLAARIPDARAFVLTGAGHLCFWEQPELFTSLVQEFLAIGAPSR